MAAGLHRAPHIQKSSGKTGKGRLTRPLQNDQAYKPSSVLSSHLSWPAVAGGLTPPPQDARAAL